MWELFEVISLHSMILTIRSLVSFGAWHFNRTNRVCPQGKYKMKPHWCNVLFFRVDIFRSPWLNCIFRNTSNRCRFLPASVGHVHTDRILHQSVLLPLVGFWFPFTRRIQSGSGQCFGFTVWASLSVWSRKMTYWYECQLAHEEEKFDETSVSPFQRAAIPRGVLIKFTKNHQLVN